MELALAEISRYMNMAATPIPEELAARIAVLAAEAPLAPSGVWARDGGGFLLCGTVGGEFDRWHRRLAVTSATDDLIAQAIGTAAVEKVMDDLEAQITASLPEGERLAPRRSPGYADMPLERNRDIASRLDTARRIGVTVSDSMALVPSKSVIAECAVTHL